jgi:threonine/homoserine/homoserine lactone efflux protein
VLGVSAVLAASAQAFTVLKVAGAAYLLWLAVRGWRSRATGTLGDLTVPTSARLGRGTAFRRALPVGVLNPKTAIFYLAFLPQFVRADAGPVPLQLAVFGVVFIVLALAFDTCWVLAGSHLARLVPRLRLRVMDRISGTVMAALAAVTLTARRAAT